MATFATFEEIIDNGLVDSAEAARILGLKNPGTLAVWRSTGRHQLPFVKVGGRVRYRRSALFAWLETRTRISGSTS